MLNIRFSCAIDMHKPELWRLVFFFDGCARVNYVSLLFRLGDQLHSWIAPQAVIFQECHHTWASWNWCKSTPHRVYFFNCACVCVCVHVHVCVRESRCWTSSLIPRTLTCLSRRKCWRQPQTTNGRFSSSQQGNKVEHHDNINTVVCFTNYRCNFW